MTDTNDMRIVANDLLRRFGGNEATTMLFAAALKLDALRHSPFANSLLFATANELDTVRDGKAQPLLDTMAHTVGILAHPIDHSQIGWWRDTVGHGNKS